MKLRECLGFFSAPIATARSLSGVISRGRGGFLRILIFHDVPPASFNLFERLIHFARGKYRFVDIKTFECMMTGDCPIKGGNILLTFDDGFKSNRFVAENILDPLGIRAVFFVCPGFIDSEDRDKRETFIKHNIFDGQLLGNEIYEGLESLSWSDVQYLLGKGHVIGSHSLSHKRLSEIRHTDCLETEIIGSADALQERLGIRIEHFAYPFGDVRSINQEALILAKKRYRYVFSGVRGGNNPKVHQSALRREAVSLDDSPAYFRFILEGGLSPYYYHDRKLLDSFARQSS